MPGEDELVVGTIEDARAWLRSVKSPRLARNKIKGMSLEEINLWRKYYGLPPIRVSYLEIVMGGKRR